MKIKNADLKQSPSGMAVITLLVDAHPSDYSDVVSQIKSGKEYELSIIPVRYQKSKDQLGAIWGKIGEIANALYANKEDVYEECLRRYGQVVAMRVKSESICDLKCVYRVVDIVKDREDGTSYVKCYKGLSNMDTAEASRLLEGILDECREMGISAEVK